MFIATKEIKVQGISIGGRATPFTLIAGPCVIESEEHTLKMAGELKSMAERLAIPFIFKSSFDKANRSSFASYRGPGLNKGLAILDKVRHRLRVPILSDIHEASQAKEAAEVLDILQIPAFLCRQTDLLEAVAKTQKPVNVKKGQFLSPWEVKNIIDKIRACGNEQILITERGTCFGYQNLVVDMRSIAIIRGFGYPLVFDATHSVQLPGKGGKCSSGERQYVPLLSRAALAVGCEALFIEVHDHPELALCDGANMLSLVELAALLPILKQIDALVKAGEEDETGEVNY